MTVDESKSLKKDSRVYWRGNAADSGIITETSWDAVTIAWNNGEVARVHHGDMRNSENADNAAYWVTAAGPTPLPHSTKPRNAIKPSKIRDAALVRF